MKSTLSRVVLISSLVLTAGCGKKESAAPAGAPSPASSAATAPVAGLKEVTIEANDAMKFSVTRFEVAPGQQVKVVFKNVGTLPKEAMGHNWVLLQKGTDVMAFSTAALPAKATDYIPDSMKGAVLAHTKLLGPKQTEELTFAAPSEPGDYPFVCSFPAHTMAGMRGVMVVK
jgi:azurin